MQMSLVMSMRGLFSAIIEMTRHVHHVFFFFGNDGNFEALDFCVCIHAPSINSETNRRMRHKK